MVVALSTVVVAISGTTPGINVVLTQPITQSYVFDIDWVGYSSARLELGSCSYSLTGVSSSGREVVSHTVNETDLLGVCGYAKTIDTEYINIEGTVKFYALSTTDDQLLYTGTVYITYPLVTKANTQTTIRLLDNSEVGVDVVIPSSLSLCGETSLSVGDPRLTTSVGSNLCVRHTIVSTSSSLLALDTLSVQLAGNDISSGIHSIVDMMRSDGYVEYRIELVSGPCLTCQYTSTMRLKSAVVALSGMSSSAGIGGVSSMSSAVNGTMAKATVELNVEAGTSVSDDGYNPIFSHRELEAVALTALILAGLSFLVLVVSLVYHHHKREVVVVGGARV